MTTPIPARDGMQVAVQGGRITFTVTYPSPFGLYVPGRVLVYGAPGTATGTSCPGAGAVAMRIATPDRDDRRDDRHASRPRSRRASSPNCAACGSRSPDFSRALVAMRGSDYSTTLKTLTPDGPARDPRRARRRPPVRPRGPRRGIRSRSRPCSSTSSRRRQRSSPQRYRTALRARLAPTDAEVREYYAAHVSRFVSVARVKASHVLVATGGRGQRRARRPRGWRAFDTIARTRSLDTQTRAAGGDLNWIQRGVMSKEFEAGASSPCRSAPSARRSVVVRLPHRSRGRDRQLARPRPRGDCRPRPHGDGR